MSYALNLPPQPQQNRAKATHRRDWVTVLEALGGGAIVAGMFAGGVALTKAAIDAVFDFFSSEYDLAALAWYDSNARTEALAERLAALQAEYDASAAETEALRNRADDIRAAAEEAARETPVDA